MSMLRLCLIVFPLALLPFFTEAADMPCADCHYDKTQYPVMHAAVTMGCENCHIDVHPGGETQKKGTFVATGKDLCLSCHDASKFSGAAVVHQPVRDGRCVTCHDPHGSNATALLRPDMPDLCITCHNKSSYLDRKVHGPVSIGDCTACHAPHLSKNRKLLKKETPALCFGCHRSSKFTGNTIHRPVKEGACLICHRPHAADNRDLLTISGNETCLPCHDNVTASPHAMAGSRQTGHKLIGEKDPRRRGRPFGCTSCHEPHRSDFQKLFRYPATKPMELCASCHKK